MDPDTNLKELLQIALDVKEIIDNPNGDGDDDTMSEDQEIELSEDQEIELTLHAERMSELVLALDEWIKKGGFLPARWKNA